MRYLLHWLDRDLYDLTAASVDLFWFEEIEAQDRLVLPAAGSLRYWNGASPWPNCGGRGYLYYLWISAILQPVVPESVTDHYVCMNRNPRPHRRAVLDLLYDRGLIGLGRISWSGSDAAVWAGDTVRWLGVDSGPVNSLPVTGLPEVLSQSAFSLVTETAVNGFDCSEKTFQCLSAGQPFLTFGCRGLHRWLTSFGFQLLPGVDYAFDREPHSETRMHLLVGEIQRLCQEDPRVLRERFQPAADHNRRLFQRIHARLRLPFDLHSYDHIGPSAQQQIEDLLNLQRDYLLHQHCSNR
jgi:hypothetical protein